MNFIHLKFSYSRLFEFVFEIRASLVPYLVIRELYPYRSVGDFTLSPQVTMLRRILQVSLLILAQNTKIRAYPISWNTTQSSFKPWDQKSFQSKCYQFSMISRGSKIVSLFFISATQWVLRKNLHKTSCRAKLWLCHDMSFVYKTWFVGHLIFLWC